ncbi:MAG: M20/M25/M40 family metallo-hydrolase [Anaerolineae bacterium]|nr:M20/M25/M40 family metallo-hydrolase [Anaerolineae bacterium]
MSSREITPAIYQQPAELLQKLIQFDTTNPPGNESECISFLNDLLTAAGIETRILAKSPERPNLIARLPGQGQAAPLLLYGHVDVVTTEKQQWQQPPFAGNQVDDYVWGRGALDMKGGIAMFVAAVLRAKAENMKPAGDIVLTIVSDEEAGGDFGAKFLVEEHPEAFAGIRYALGEFGGFTLSLGNRRFYPIQIAEKQICWLRVTLRGPGGHGSLPVRGGAMSKLSRLLQQLDKRRLPVHITPPVRLMFGEMGATLGGVSGLMMGQLLNPWLTDGILNLLGERGRLFDPLLHHTVSPTILQGSDKINVIPGEVAVELDGRLLPGFGPDDLVHEVRAIVGADVEIEVIRYDPGPAEPDMGLFDSLATILKEADPHGVPIPLLLSGVTDGRFFSRLGIQTYGFTPMLLPEGFNFTQTIHSADERIPVTAVEFGAHAVYQALQRA